LILHNVLILTGSILTRAIDVQTRVRHAASYARVNSTDVDSFIDVGHTLGRESLVDMDMFNREWTGCSSPETGRTVDLD
jgi:hypothetical protein